MPNLRSSTLRLQRSRHNSLGVLIIGRRVIRCAASDFNLMKRTFEIGSHLILLFEGKKCAGIIEDINHHFMNGYSVRFHNPQFYHNFSLHDLDRLCQW